VGEPAPSIQRVDDPTALLRSLGSPRLAGNRHAEHYLAAVYDKAAGLASAIAAAGGLLEDPDFTVVSPPPS